MLSHRTKMSTKTALAVLPSRGKAATIPTNLSTLHASFHPRTFPHLTLSKTAIFAEIAKRERSSNRNFCSLKTNLYVCLCDFFFGFSRRLRTRTPAIETDPAKNSVPSQMFGWVYENCVIFALFLLRSPPGDEPPPRKVPLKM